MVSEAMKGIITSFSSKLPADFLVVTVVLLMSWDRGSFIFVDIALFCVDCATSTMISIICKHVRG